MAPGKESEFGATLVDKIKAHIRRELSPRHVPAFVLRIDDIPVGGGECNHMAVRA